MDSQEGEGRAVLFFIVVLSNAITVDREGYFSKESASPNWLDNRGSCLYREIYF